MRVNGRRWRSSGSQNGYDAVPDPDFCPGDPSSSTGNMFTQLPVDAPVATFTRLAGLWKGVGHYRY